MPDLTGTKRWLEYEPDLLGNRESDRPFYFRLNGSLSKTQLEALDAAISQRSALPDLPKDATAEQKDEHAEAVRVSLVERYAGALEPHVKLGDEPLRFDEVEVKTLRDYFDAVTKYLPGLEVFMEPYRALLNANVLGVSSSFSSGRLSGGFTSTASRRNGKAGGRTVAH